MMSWALNPVQISRIIHVSGQMILMISWQNTWCLWQINPCPVGAIFTRRNNPIWGKDSKWPFLSLVHRYVHKMDRLLQWDQKWSLVSGWGLLCYVVSHTVQPAILSLCTDLPGIIHTPIIPMYSKEKLLSFLSLTQWSDRQITLTL